jgi:predicted nucleic acid-binding protein
MPNAKMSCFVDTSVLVYAVDPTQPDKQPIAASLLRRTIRNRTLVLSLQSLNECYRVITDKRLLLNRANARDFVYKLSPACTAPLDFGTVRSAWLIQDQTNFAIWDCLLLASASLAGCEIFLSEDMQHERQILNVKILNPFKLEHLTDLPI